MSDNYLYDLFINEVKHAAGSGVGSGGGSSAQPDLNAAEGQPGHVLNRTHWVEQGHEEIVSGEYTSTYMDVYGCFVCKETFFDFLEEIPKIVSIIFDGVSYENLTVTSIDGVGNFTGNLYFLNAKLGTSFANTGEPFICVLFDNAVHVLTLDTQETVHSVTLYKNSNVYKRLNRNYMPEFPIIDLSEHVVFGMIPTDEVISYEFTCENFKEKYYDVARNSYMVRLRYRDRTDIIDKKEILVSVIRSGSGYIYCQMSFIIGINLPYAVTVYLESTKARVYLKSLVTYAI